MDAISGCYEDKILKSDKYHNLPNPELIKRGILFNNTAKKLIPILTIN
jgi:hypothetical protein